MTSSTLPMTGNGQLSQVYGSAESIEGCPGARRESRDLTYRRSGSINGFRDDQREDNSWKSELKRPEINRSTVFRGL